jgi:hypothetical protein
MIKLSNRLMGQVISSPDDGGWYAEIFTRSGKQVDTTDLHDTRRQAERQAAEIASDPSNEKYMWE